MRSPTTTFMKPYANFGQNVTGRTRKYGWLDKICIAITTILCIILGVGCVRQIASAKEIGIRARQITVTAFNSVPEQTDSTPCTSADGSNICALEAVGDHSCAASFPFGTRIWVSGFGLCTVRDRLSQKYSYRLDLHFGGRSEIGRARAWGKRTMTVLVID